jgi:hypothetical protein
VVALLVGFVAQSLRGGKMSDAFVDAVAWRYCAFLRTGNGEFWRIWFDDNEPLIEKLVGNESEWVEPLTELKRRAAKDGK